MPANFEVDQFASPEAWDALIERNSNVMRTLGALGLVNQAPEESGTLFGGGALAVQLIDGYIPHPHGLDVDVAVPAQTFDRIGEKWGYSSVVKFGHGFQGRLRASSQIPLPVDVLTTTEPDELQIFTAGQPLEAATFPLDGANIVSADIVLAQKASAIKPRVKDLATVIRSHLVTAGTGHPMAGSKLWDVSVGVAADRLMDGDVETPAWRRAMRKGPNYPSWLQQLVERDFEHPAFANIPRLSKES
jgi:hypothetical protein